MYHRVRKIRSTNGGKSIFAMDFQNDGEFVGGCIAGEETIATLIRTEMWNRVYLSIILEPI